MANVMFKKGLHSALPTSGAVEGAFYLTTDSDRLYIGKADGTLADLNKYVKIIASLADGATLPAGQEGDFLYIQDSNILAVFTGGKWKQVNPDTNTNTSYDLKAEAGTDKAVIKLGAKEIGDESFTYTEKFTVAGTGIATVSYEGSEIKIHVPATDLSAYATIEYVDGEIDKVEQEVAKKANKSYVDEELAKKADKSYIGEFTASEGVDTVVKYIDAKTANIASDETVGQIDERVKALEETTVPGIDNRVKTLEETTVPGIGNRVKTLEETTIPGLAEDISELENGQVKANKEAIETLNGNNTVEGSVDNKIKIAIDNFTEAYITDDGGAIDKLQEIVDWINNDDTGATQIVADIEANKEAIEGLDEAVNQLTAGKADVEQLKDYYTKTEADAEFMNANEVDAKITELALGTMSKETASDYVKKIEAPGYDDILTTTAAASTYRTEGQVNGQIDAKLANYHTKEDIANELAAYYTKDEINETISGYYTKEEAEEAFMDAEEVDSAISTAINGALEWGSF